MFPSCSSKDSKSQFLELAQGHFDNQKFELARGEYAKVLKINPGNKKAIAQIGLSWMRQGLLLRAIPFLLEMRKLAPEDTVIRLQLLNALMGLQALPDAGKEAASILAMSPDCDEALLALAECVGSREELLVASAAVEKFPRTNQAVGYTARALLALSSKNSDVAKDALLNALEMEPNYSPAIGLYARLLAALKEDDKAGEQFKLQSKLSPIRSLESLHYPNYLLSRQSFADASEVCAHILQAAPDYVPALCLAAQAALGENRTDAAQGFVARVIALDRDNFEAGLLQGQVLIAQEKLASAIEILEKLLIVAPSHPTVTYHLVAAYLKQGNVTKAAPLLKPAFAANPQSVELALMMAAIKISEGQAEEVISEMHAILRRKPGLVGPMRMLATACQASGRKDRLEEAASTMVTLVKAMPSNGDFVYQLGEIYRQSGKFDESRTAFETILKGLPKNLPSIIHLVEMDVAEGKYDSAMQRLSPLLTEGKGDADVFYYQATIFAAQEKWMESEKCLMQAIEVRNDYEPAYQALIQVYMQTKQLPSALERAELLLKRDPANQQALMVSGLICEELKDFAAARRYYEKLRSVNGSLPAVLNNLAGVLGQQLNEVQRAYEIAQEARKLRPSVERGAPPTVRIEAAAIADTLGWLHYQRGEYAQAIRLTVEAAAEFGQKPEVQYHIGMAAAMMGNLQLAKEKLEDALKAEGGLPADFPGRKDATIRLGLIASATSGKPPGSPELEGLIKDSPADPLLWLLLGAALERDQVFVKAGEAYAKALSLNPELVTAMIGQARLYAGPLQDAGKAIELVRLARKLAVSDADAGVLGTIAMDALDYPYAYALLSQAANGEGADETVLLRLGRTAYYLGKLSEARNTMERLSKRSPESSKVSEAASFLELTKPEFDPDSLKHAYATAELAVKGDPGNVAALVLIARVDAKEGRREKARAVCEGLLKKIPEFGPALVRLAEISADAPANLDAAWDFAQRALTKVPEDVELRWIVAKLCFLRKDYAEGRQKFEALSRLKPLSPEGLYYWGMCQWNTEDKETARKTLTQALAAGLEAPLSTEAGRLLAGQSGN